MATKFYTKEYAGMLANIFKSRARFLRSFGGKLQVKDGVKDTDNFLLMKTTDSEVVIQDYSTDANVGFGTGTGTGLGSGLGTGLGFGCFGTQQQQTSKYGLLFIYPFFSNESIRLQQVHK